MAISLQTSVSVEEVCFLERGNLSVHVTHEDLVVIEERHSIVFSEGLEEECARPF